MEITHWYLVIGALLILLVLAQGGVSRMPITTAMLYLGLGWIFGLLGWARIDPFQYVSWLEHLSEIAVIVSLFSAGRSCVYPCIQPSGSRLFFSHSARWPSRSG